MKTHTHQQYKTKDGTIVPGTTTILGILEKPALLYWAWDLGKQGIDFQKARQKAADIGTIAHYLIQCHLKNEKPEISEFPPADLDKAENAFIAYLDFEKINTLKPLQVEISLVSEQFRYGGTIDLYAECNGELALIDFKTSKAVYPEMRCQVAAYKNLLEENGYNVQKTHLLRIDKENGEFNHHFLGDLEKEWEFFKALIPVYNLKKEIWKK